MDLHTRETAVAAAKAFIGLTTEMRETLAAAQKDANESTEVGPSLAALSLQHSVNRADLLAHQLLAYAAAQPLVPVRVELLPFLSDLAFTLLQTLDARIFVSVDVGRECPPCLADRHALREALLNLVLNARDAMPEGGRLQLSARAVKAPDAAGEVAISVSDSGVGMSAEFAHRALEPFVTTKTGQICAGMGLAATDGFARQSGGGLALRLRETGGVIATITLPQAARRDEPSSLRASLASPSAVASHDDRGEEAEPRPG